MARHLIDQQNDVFFTRLAKSLHAKEETTSQAILGVVEPFSRLDETISRHKSGKAWEPQTTLVLNRRANCVERMQGSPSWRSAKKQSKLVGVLSIKSNHWTMIHRWITIVIAIKNSILNQWVIVTSHNIYIYSH